MNQAARILTTLLFGALGTAVGSAHTFARQ